MKRHLFFLLIGILFSVLIIPVHSEMVDIIDGSIDEKSPKADSKEFTSIYNTGDVQKDKEYLIEQGLISSSDYKEKREKTPLSAPIENLNSVASAYVSGDVSEKEMMCSFYTTQYLLSTKDVIKFISSMEISDIKKNYGVVITESDWESGRKGIVERNYISIDDIFRYKMMPDKVVLYYSLNKENPFIISFNVLEETSDYKEPPIEGLYEWKEIDMEIKIISSSLVLEEQWEFRENCFHDFYKPLTLEMFDNVTKAIDAAKKSGIDTTGAEEKLKNSEEEIEKGLYDYSYSSLMYAMELLESAQKLKDFQILSHQEKTILIQEDIAHIINKKNKTTSKVVTIIPEDEINEHGEMGLNIQFNLYLDNESNSLLSYTEVVDVQNKTLTSYENQLVGEYDTYIAVDYLLGHELMLMEEANVGMFNYGKRFGKAIISGEIKFKPIWKLYKIISLISGDSELEEFGKGIMSEI